MRAFSYILVLIPLVTPFAAAEWYSSTLLDVLR